MRSPIAALIPALALAVTGCGAPKLALPADPIGKAATCGVVAAANARVANTSDVSAPLPFEKQGQIVHYALLAGADDGAFSLDRAAAVMQRMQEIQEDVTSGKWQDLVQPCQAAFPEASPSREVALPQDPLEAQLGCYMLSKFMVKALAAQSGAYDKELVTFGALNRDLDPKIAKSLDRRGIRSEKAREGQQDSALAKVAKLGTPAKVMGACTARFT
jgi:hypothetical protein